MIQECKIDGTISFEIVFSSIWDKMCTTHSIVTSLEQLSLAEFRGEKVRPNVYKNDHKNGLGEHPLMTPQNWTLLVKKCWTW